MDAQSALEAVAQIGVALLGFAGIVGALAGDKLRPRHQEVWLPFWVMITSGLGVLLGALFPLLPYHLGAPDHVVWSASSALVVVATAWSIAFFIPRILRAQRDGVVPKLPAFDIPLRIGLSVLILSQVLNTFGVVFPQNAGGYLIGMYASVLGSGLNFLFLVYTLARTPGQTPAA